MLVEVGEGLLWCRSSPRQVVEKVVVEKGQVGARGSNRGEGGGEARVGDIGKGLMEVIVFTPERPLCRRQEL